MTAPRNNERYVVDSSAVLAFLGQEAGGEIVGPRLRNAIVTAVNWSEVVQTALDYGIAVAQMRDYLRLWGLQIVGTAQAEAELAAELRSRTRRFGLSLGDRICLATGVTRRLPILTTDRAWTEVPLDVEVELIR